MDWNRAGLIRHEKQRTAQRWNRMDMNGRDMDMNSTDVNSIDTEAHSYAWPRKDADGICYETQRQSAEVKRGGRNRNGYARLSNGYAWKRYATEEH